MTTRPIQSTKLDLTGMAEEGWRTALSWAITGLAVVGAVAAAAACVASVVCGVAAGIAIGVGIGVAAGALSYTAETAGTDQFSAGGLATSAAVGGVTGLIPGGVGAGIRAGASRDHFHVDIKNGKGEVKVTIHFRWR